MQIISFSLPDQQIAWFGMESASPSNCLFIHWLLFSCVTMDPTNNVVVPMAFSTEQNFPVTNSMDTSTVENENFDAQAARKPWLKRPGAAIGTFYIKIDLMY